MKSISVSASEVSTLLIVAIVAAILGLWLVLRLMTNAVRQQKTRLVCKWKRTSADDRGALIAWKCKACGVTAYSGTGKRPVDCKQITKPKSL